jgi:hypothetical protein
VAGPRDLADQHFPGGLVPAVLADQVYRERAGGLLADTADLEIEAVLVRVSRGDHDHSRPLTGPACGAIRGQDVRRSPKRVDGFAGGGCGGLRKTNGGGETGAPSVMGGEQ